VTHVHISSSEWNQRLATTSGLRFTGVGDGSNGSLRGSKTMSGCAYEPKVSAFYDGELPETERAAFEAHLAGCAICTAELERVQSLSDELRAARQPRLTEMDKARLRQTAAAEAGRLAKGDGRWARWLTAAAAAVFLVSVSQIYLTHHNPDGSQNPTPISDPNGSNGNPSHPRRQSPTAPADHQPAQNHVNPES